MSNKFIHMTLLDELSQTDKYELEEPVIIRMISPFGTCDYTDFVVTCDAGGTIIEVDISQNPNNKRGDRK